MLWEEYYDKIGEWETSTAVSRMSKLESFGPPDEIIDAINQIGFDDEKGATRLLKKATAAGVKFSGEQLSDLCLICDEEVLGNAIQFSSDVFTVEDLDALYGCYDDDALINIAKKQKIHLTGNLAELAEAESAELEENDEYLPPNFSEEKAEYGYILDCLYEAHALLAQAKKFSLIDTSRKKRAATVFKYHYLIEAESHISNAITAWKRLEVPNKEEQLLCGISLNISSSTMWSNYLFEGFLTNWMVKKQIRKVMKNIEHAYSVIQKLRESF